MRILLLGDTSQRLDEGAKNVAHYLARELAQRHEVLRLHQREVLRPAALWQAWRFKPQVLMSVQGPSSKTIVLLALLKRLLGAARSLVVGAQPQWTSGVQRALAWFRPDLVFAQSQRWLTRFSSAGVAVQRLGNGVNLAKFKPAEDAQAVAALRAELGLAPEAKVMLHIGPLNANRNHELLMRVQRETDWQVLVIGSETAPCVPAVEQALRDSGVLVLRRYLPEVQLVYALAEVYVFPVEDPGGSIEFPLTVLEAMACDRPVLSTRFLALPEYLHEGPALRWFSGFDELMAKLPLVLGQVGNRAQAEAFGWQRIMAQVEQQFSAKPSIGAKENAWR
jgi:glycosyltransferase involved in cell wall biosynthesis